MVAVAFGEAWRELGTSARRSTIGWGHHKLVLHAPVSSLFLLFACCATCDPIGDKKFSQSPGLLLGEGDLRGSALTTFPVVSTVTFPAACSFGECSLAGRGRIFGAVV